MTNSELKKIVAKKIAADKQMEGLKNQLDSLHRLEAVKQELAKVETLLKAADLDRNKAILEAHQNGLSYRQIGRALGLSHPRIQQILKAQGK